MDSQQPQPVTPTQPAPVVPPAPAVQPPPPSPSVPTEPTAPSAPAPKASHKKLFVSLVVIFILLSVGLGLYTLYMTKSAQVMYQDAYKNRPQVTATVAPTETPAVEGVKSGDAQIDQQSLNIDAGLDSLNKDITSVDRGLKDQPDNLSQ